MLKNRHIFHYSDYSKQWHLTILLQHLTTNLLTYAATSAESITKCVSHEVVESTGKPDPTWYGWVLVTRAIFTGGIVAVVIYCQQHKVGHREEEPHERQHIGRNPPWTNLKSIGLGLIQRYSCSFQVSVSDNLPLTLLWYCISNSVMYTKDEHIRYEWEVFQIIDITLTSNLALNIYCIRNSFFSLLL